MDRTGWGYGRKSKAGTIERSAFNRARIREGIHSMATGLSDRCPGPSEGAGRCEP